MASSRGEAMQASVELAKQRGPFPDGFKRVSPRRANVSSWKAALQARRNATVTTGCADRNDQLDRKLLERHQPIYSIAYRRLSFESSDCGSSIRCRRLRAAGTASTAQRLMKRIANRSSLRDSPEVSAEARRVFVTTHEIAPDGTFECKQRFRNTSTQPFQRRSTVPIRRMHFASMLMRNNRRALTSSMSHRQGS